MAANGALEKVSRGVAAAGHCVPGSKMIVLAVVVLWGRLKVQVSISDFPSDFNTFLPKNQV